MKNIFNHAIPAWQLHQIKLKMKLSVILTLVLLIQVQANILYGQQDRITLRMNDKTVGELIDRIENDTEYRFTYKVKDVNKSRIINVNFTNVTIEELLQKVFGNTATAWSLSGNQIFLTQKKQDTSQIGKSNGSNISTINSKITEIGQEPVTGIVSDAGGPMPGVVVSVKGKNISTITDDFGYFSIEANSGDILVFSYPGYDIMEAAVGSRTSFAIELQESVTELENAVINAGYYTVRDRERTGSISRITAKEIENQPVNTAMDALQGRITGVDIISTTGLAGGGYEIRIRGQNSIAAGNEPLFVIDGVPYDMGSLSNVDLSVGVLYKGLISPLNTLDPSTIESIEVLKDADATAIYGSRGANGVVLITTKQGKKGKTAVSIEASTTLVSTTLLPDLLNTQQYLAMRREALANDGFTEYPSDAYDVNGTWDQNRYTDWQKELIGNTAFNNSVRFTVSGGGEQTKFLVGGSFMKENTVFPMNFNYKRNTAFVNISHSSKNERFRVQFSGNYGQDNNFLPTFDLTRRSRILPPNAPALYNEDGTLNWENNTWDNPLAALNATYRNNANNLMANSVVSYEIFKGLTLKTNMGYNSSDMIENWFQPNTIRNPAWGVTSASSTAKRNNGQRNSWILEPQLDAFYKVGPGNLNVLVGVTLQEENYESLTLSAYGFPDNSLINNFSAAYDVQVSREQASQYRYMAAYGRINYNLLGKYILNLTGRRDGSSRFGPGRQFANFGAVGTAWLFSKEQFMEEIAWLSSGKLRASYGTTGNDQIGDYQFLSTYTITDGNYDGNMGLNPTRLFNPYFAWEKSRKIEVALEAGFFKDRINFEVAYYNNRSDNQLLGIPLPGTTGFTSINGNLDATIENSGWEISFQSTNFRNKDFRWNTSLMLTVPKNKLIAFDGLENSTYANQLVIGLPISIWRSYLLTGVNQETGLFEFEDFNGDGIISIEDRQYNVDLTPKFYGSIVNNIQYKRWNLDFMFQFVKKKAFNEFYTSEPPGLMLNHSTGVLDHWQEPGDNAFMQLYTTGWNFDAYMAYSQFTSSNAAVSDASFIRLKSLSLSYSLPLENRGTSKCTIFVQGQNLLTFTKFTGGDPEGQFTYLPPVKRVSFGVKLEF